MIGRYREKLKRRALIARTRIEKDTQRLRAWLIGELEEMLMVAKSALNRPGITAEEAQNWMRIIGYLGQVLNSISKSLDEAQALEYLENLERMISNEPKSSSEKS